MVSPRPSGPRPRLELVGLFVVVGLACGGPGEPCERLGQLCVAETRARDVWTRVDDAVAIDLDGDGEDEIVAITRDGFQLALGHRSGWRSVVFPEQRPVALAELPGEVAVAVADPPAVAIFGADPSGRLERRRDLALDAAPGDLWSGDLDGDGRPELLVTHPLAGRLTVLAADSGEARNLAVAGSPGAVAVGDLDGDGLVDIVVADPPGSAVHVLRGAGGGEFHPARRFFGAATADGLALADHDGDGDLDVLTRNVTRPGVTVLHSNGAGELALPLELVFGEPAPTGSGLAAGTASAEGLASVSVPQGDALATWVREGTKWIGHLEAYLFEPATWVGSTPTGLLVGGLGFVARFDHQEGATPVELWRDASVLGGYGDAALATGDLDGDGALDVAAATDGVLHVFLGEGEGFTKVATVQLDATPKMMAIAEVTGDGRPDIVLSDKTVVRVVQAGADGFTLRAAHTPAVPPRVLAPLRTGAGSLSVVAAVPNDASSAYGPPTSGVALLRFGVDGLVAEETALLESAAVKSLIAVDLDDDGVDEPVYFARRGGAPVFGRMTPAGVGFEPGPEHDLAAVYDVPADVPEHVTLAAGDPDQDGEPEVWLGAPSGTLRIFDLGADPPTVVEGVDLLPASQFRDVDGDGRLDAVATGTYSDFWYQRGLGDGSFEVERHGHDFPVTVALAFAAEAGAQFDVASMSLEAVATHRLRNVVRPVPAGEEFDFHGRATELVVGDVDRDGHDDVVTASGDWGGGVQVLWGDTSGALARADGFNDFIESRGLTLGDLDGDGVSEVVVSSAISYVEAYHFRPQREEVPLLLEGLNTLQRVLDLAVADVDGDGHPDVVALAYSKYEELDIDGMRVYVAYGLGGDKVLDFTEWTRVLEVPELEDAWLGVGDVDGEGHLDVLVRPAYATAAPVLVLADGPRGWAEPLTLPGKAAVFSERDAEGGVELLVQDDVAVAQWVDGEPGRRRELLRHASLAEGLLRRVADVDADGRGDLIVLTPASHDVWVRGDDGYGLALSIPFEEMQSVDVADIDGDGRPDLVGLGPGGVVVRLAAAP